jgi:3-oxoacyl-[acyl-carrier protein] reductase
MDMDVKGKAAIVTGGGTGVGQATGIALGKLGCSVLVNYSRSKNEAEQTASEIEKLGVKAIPFKADVSVDSECREMVKTAVDKFGRLDILVNNAGTTRFINHSDLEEVKDDDWERILMVNLKGPFQCARAAKEAIESSGGGDIINVASVAGIIAVGSCIPYCASKAGLINLTVSMARVFAPKIRVNAVAPGFIDGSWLQKGFGDAYESIKNSVAERSPMNNVTKPEDIAATILSLITGSDLVTGQCLACDAGLMISQNI